MAYEVKDFSSLLGTTGFSDDLLNTHFKLYQGYVANTNKLVDKLTAMSGDDIQSPEYAELKRRFGWEFNGMRLHEYYFANMSKEVSILQEDGALHKQIVQDFGSYDQWLADFKGTGSLRGIGWSILSYDPIGKRLFNTWINEHDLGHLAGAQPILVMDVFEHAFVLDYGMQRAQYIDAFVAAINWQEAERRFTA
ncbi:MAG: superoxide dismutase [Candidatus Komeilibacteria bacterium]